MVYTFIDILLKLMVELGGYIKTGFFFSFCHSVYNNIFIRSLLVFHRYPYSKAKRLGAKIYSHNHKHNTYNITDF